MSSTALLGLAYAVFLLQKTPLPPAQVSYTALFILLGVALELTAVETLQLGASSLLSFCAMSLCVMVGPGLACTAAAGAIAVRLVCRSRAPWSLRLADFSLSFIPIALAAFVYGLLADTAGSLRPAGLGALGLAVVAYLVSDLLASVAGVQLLDEPRQWPWQKMRMRARLVGAGILPLGLVSCLLAADATSARTSALAPLLLLLPLLVIGRAQRQMLTPQTPEVESEESPEQAATRLREELNDYKQQNRALMADLHKRVDEIAILRDMGQQLGASKDLDKTLEIVISMIRKLLIYQSCVIYLVDERGALVPEKCISPFIETIQNAPLLQLEESMVNLVVHSKKPVLVSDMQGDSEHRIFHDEKSIMCVPLIVVDVIIGVIYVGTLRPGTYNDDHVHVLETLANPAAIAIRSAQYAEHQEEVVTQERQLKEQVEARVNQMNVLYHLATELTRTIKLDELLDIIADKLSLLIEFQSCILFTLRKQDGQLVASKVKSPYEGLFTNFVTSPDDEGVIGWVATQKRKFMVTDTSESRYNLIERERSFMVLPMLAEEEVIGEVYVGSAEAGTYDEEDLAVLEMVAAQAAMAIQKALLFQDTQSLAITDGVTGLYTHRYFQERLAEEVRWAARYERNLSLIMVDTDHFKKYNDTLGHPEGDKLLKEISALLRSYTRDSDLVCRYGGDEFSLILKDTDKEAAVRTAERIRDAFQLRFGKLTVKVTASIGVSNFPIDARSKAELVTAADTALYKSKQGGRNRVSRATPLDGGHAAQHQG